MTTRNLPLPIAHRSRPRATTRVAVRRPLFDCQEHADRLTLVVYVPGVNAAGVEITTRGPDLRVLARKTRFVRVNWRALHLEKAQNDYELTLRLGYGLDYANLTAELADGVLTITLRKRSTLPAGVRRAA
ncbi:MAG: Hsp20/alpha crystallin family protein [Opitutae bacterium]|nr:Hsp20/alpha crystallin family protein [Opitutae bacterium]